MHHFQSEIWLPVPPETVFPFFADAANLEAITPSWLRFHIVSAQPIAMGEGTLIDYRLRVHGLPLRWRTRINQWQPPRRFVDEQIRGPYRLWMHEHTFEPDGGGTRARDHVRYAVRLDWLLHRRFVQNDIKRIFEFRAEALRNRFGSA